MFHFTDLKSTTLPWETHIQYLSPFALNWDYLITAILPNGFSDTNRIKRIGNDRQIHFRTGCNMWLQFSHINVFHSKASGKKKFSKLPFQFSNIMIFSTEDLQYRNMSNINNVFNLSTFDFLYLLQTIFTLERNFVSATWPLRQKYHTWDLMIY